MRSSQGSRLYADPIRATPKDMNGARILVVEDQEDIQLAARLCLEIAGYEIGVASTANEALSILDASLPDLLLLDITLPMVSGWKLLERLRADTRFAAMRIIVLSGLAGERSEKRALSLGADGYLVKPFEFEALVATVSRTLVGGAQP